MSYKTWMTVFLNAMTGAISAVKESGRCFMRIRDFMLNKNAFMSTLAVAKEMKAKVN